MHNGLMWKQLTTLVWIGTAIGLSTGSGPRMVPTAEAAPATVRYQINAAHSQFTAHVFKAGLFKAFGHDHTVAISQFSGEVRTTPRVLVPATLHLTIRADSLTIADTGHQSDRPKVERTMREQVLEITRYPTISYTGTASTATRAPDGTYRVNLTGDLTLHGVTRQQPVIAQVSVRGHTLQARGAFSIHQTDYNIKPVAAVGGTVKVKNEIQFTFDIVADEVAVASPLAVASPPGQWGET